MEIIKLEVQPETILALKIVAPTNDMRAYINSIFVEIGEDGVILGATDGHRMLVHRLQDQGELPSLRTAIPITYFNGIKKSGSFVTIELGPSNGTPERDVIVRQNGVAVTGKTMVLEPVKWRTPIKPVTGKMAQFNAEYLGDFAKIYKLLHPKATMPLVRVYHNGEEPAVVDLQRSDFFAVLMPIRMKEKEKENPIPSWVMR